MVSNPLRRTNTATKKKRAIVVGAGPGGLLTAIHLLNRSDEYEVTLVYPGRAYSRVDDLSPHRS